MNSAVHNHANDTVECDLAAIVDMSIYVVAQHSAWNWIGLLQTLGEIGMAGVFIRGVNLSAISLLEIRTHLLLHSPIENRVCKTVMLEFASRISKISLREYRGQTISRKMLVWNELFALNRSASLSTCLPSWLGYSSKKY